MSRLPKGLGELFPGLDMNQLSFLDLLEDFFQGVIVTDSQGRVLFVNPVQAAIDDLPALSLVGKRVTDIYQVDEGESPTLQCLESGRAIKGVACYYRTCTGKVINSIHNIFPLFVGSRIVGTLCFIQDFSTLEQGFEAVFQTGKRKSLQGSGRLPRLWKPLKKQRIFKPPWLKLPWGKNKSRPKST